MPRRRTLLVIAAVAVGLPILADRVVAHVAAGELADRLSCAGNLDEPPSVSIGGLTVIDQLIAARFGEVEAVAHDVERAGLTLSEVTVVATDVDLDELTAGAVTAEVTIGYDTLATGRDVAVSGQDGLVVFQLDVPIRGREVPVSVYAEPVLDGDQLTVEPVEVDVMGLRLDPDRLPGDLAQDMAGRELPELPDGLDYSGATANDDGLRVTVTGTEISAGPGGRGDDECGGTPA